MVPARQAYSRTPVEGNPTQSEGWALLEAARQLNETRNGDRDTFLAALRRNWRLWTIFQASLLDPDCTVPTEIRGNLLGLANFIDKRTAELLGTQDASRVDVLININRQIGEGLLAGARAAASAVAPAAIPSPGVGATLGKIVA